MSQEVFTILAGRIAGMLKRDSQDIARILEILNDQEKGYLLGKFGVISSGQAPEEIEDIILKTEALTSLIIILRNNPRFQEALENIATIEKNPDKELLRSLYRINFDLYKVYLERQSFTDQYKNLLVLCLTTTFAVLSDRNVEFDINIRNVFNSYKEAINNTVVSVESLEYVVWVTFLAITKKQSTREDINEVQELISLCETLISALQEEVLKPAEELDITLGFRIATYANIIYILKCVSNYLFTGIVETEDGNKDIYSLIDQYSYNAIKLSETNQQVEVKALINLTRFVLQQLCNNSIWEIIDRTPLFKKFFDSINATSENFLLSLLPSQRDSLLEVLTTKKSIVLNMPTSSGKSLLAELYILFTIQNYTTSDFKPVTCYIVPTNALLNQVEQKLKKEFAPFGFTIETALPFYDIDEIEEEILKQPIDILISTPEKLDFLIRKEHPSLKDLKLVILDEAHNLSDRTRGAKFELLLATLKQRRKEVNYLLLSPFVKNYKEIAEWLGDSKKDSAAISIQWSPTKQYIGANILNKEKTNSSIIYYPSGTNNIINEPIEIDLGINPKELQKQIKSERLDHVVRTIILSEKYLKLNGTILILCEGPPSAEKMAKKALSYFKEEGSLDEISSDLEIQKAKTLISLEADDTHPLIDCLKYGIAFHHAKLSSLIKDEIENLTSKRKIKLLFATTTLAQGMNFPISTVIFDSISRRSRGGPSVELTGSEFWNIAGRAGRAYMDSEGHIILPFQENKKRTEETVHKYIAHNIKEVISSLNEFFEEVSNDPEFSLKLIESHPAVSNFLQYLNHIMRVGYKYNFSNVDSSRIASILSSSLYYKELAFKEGFLESQQKIRDFSLKYIDYLKGQNTGRLTLADLFGISNISLNRLSGKIESFKAELSTATEGATNENAILASKIILNSKDSKSLAKIVEIINVIPEIKLEIFGKGQFNPESVAKIIIGWVNGRTVKDIATEIRYKNEDFNEVLGKCFQYVNTKIKSFIPWGVSIYQHLTGDGSDDDSKYLPSYIYYGVNDKDSVVISKVGVPRFAVKTVLEIYKSKYPTESISIENIKKIKDNIKSFISSDYNQISTDGKQVKEIIDTRIF